MSCPGRRACMYAGRMNARARCGWPLTSCPPPPPRPRPSSRDDDDPAASRARARRGAGKQASQKEHFYSGPGEEKARAPSGQMLLLLLLPTFVSRRFRLLFFFTSLATHRLIESTSLQAQVDTCARCCWRGWFYWARRTVGGQHLKKSSNVLSQGGLPGWVVLGSRPRPDI